MHFDGTFNHIEKDVAMLPVTIIRGSSGSGVHALGVCHISEMAAKKLGSAVVVRSGKVAGIFTMVDACNALVELLQGPAVQRNSAEE